MSIFNNIFKIKPTDGIIAMKPQPKQQKNEILFIDRVKFPVNRNGNMELAQKILKIDLNGAQLFRSSPPSNNSSLNKQSNSSSLESVEIAESSFVISPQTEIYQINPNDIGFIEYLKQIKVIKEKSDSACFYCQPREGFMFPVLFQSKISCLRFHEAVLIYKMYHRHNPGFRQMRQNNNLNLGMNMRLLESLAKSIVRQDIIIDPEDLSVIQLEQFQLQIIKDAIQQLVNKTTAQSRISSNSVNRSSSISNIPILFSLHLRYKIVDQISLSYLPQIISKQILCKNMKQFDISRCGVNDRILSIMLKSEEKTNFILRSTFAYQNLVRLDLSNNQLTDLTFVTLTGFFVSTPKLADLNLSGNLIKLESFYQMKKQEKENTRMSMARLSTGFPSGLLSKNEPPFIQFLSSLQFLPLNYLNLDNNLIQQTQLLVNYIIEGENVPVRYLSIKNNKISEVDKIRMAKLIMSQIRERKDEGSLTTVDFGFISVVDQEVSQYAMLLKEKFNQLGFNLQEANDANDRRRSTKQISSLSSVDLRKFQLNQPNFIKVSISHNREWELCDQQGILQVNNLYKSRRKTSFRRSQIINNILMNSSLSPSNSSSNLKKDDKPAEVDHITSQTFKPTVGLLYEAYTKKNYSGVHIYKQLLKQYNIDLYNKKVAPLFVQQQKQIQNEQQQILNKLDQLINFQVASKDPANSDLPLSGTEFYLKLDALISRLFLLRFENEVKESVILYEGQDEEEELLGHFTWNVFTFLLYLKHLCGEKVQKMIESKFNPIHELNRKFKKSPELYTKYYLSHRSQLCDDNYQQKLEQLLKKQVQVESPNQSTPSSNVQKEINQLIRDKYLRKCKVCAEDLKELHRVTEEEKFLCVIQPRLLHTGFLIKYYCPRLIPSLKKKTKTILPIINCQLLVNTLKIAEPISQNISNFLSFTSSFDMLLVPPLCINPNIPPNMLATHESLKLSVYNPDFEPTLIKFSQIVIAFIKFLHHSPHKVLPQTLQYLNYLINLILSEQDSYNVQCMSTEFYIQLFTSNADNDVEARAKQIDPNILLTLVEFVSFYLPHSQMIEDYIIGHTLRAEMALNRSNKVSSCRMLRHDEPRFQRKEDQLPPEMVTNIFTGPHQTGSRLEMALQINFSDPSSEENKAIINLHILATIDDLYNQIERMGLHKRLGTTQDHGYRGEIAAGNKNWGLFLLDISSQKMHLLLPSSTEKISIYTLYRSCILSPTSPKKQFHIKPLLMWMGSPLAQFTNQLQTRWYFQQIYQAFRQYGSYLSLISIGDQNMHVVQVAILCMLCHILLEEKERMEDMVSREEMWKEEVKDLGESYIGQLQQYCPKGTASTLSSQQKKYIQQEMCKELEQILHKLHKMQEYYSQTVLKQIAQFQKRCELITCASAIYSPLSQQELLVTTHGIMQINRTIYVEALYWRDVYSINVLYEADEVNIKCIEIYTHANQDKMIKINGIPNSNQDRIFLNACLILIRNVALWFLRADIDKLYKHVSKFVRIDEDQAGIKNHLESKSGQQTESPAISIWQQLNSCIQYRPVVKKQPINLEKVKQQSFSQPVQIVPSPSLIQPKKAVQPPQQKLVKKQTQLELRKNDSEKKVESSDLQISQIVSNLEQESKKKDQSEENIVITNSRRSSRRELPKRRSSRDK